MWPLLYNLFLFPLSKILVFIISPFNEKIASSRAGKKAVWSRLSQAIKARDETKKLIWFHAPSAGEFIQLQPLLETFLSEGYECLVTYNSISAEKWIKKSKIHAPRQPLFMDYLPYDSRQLIRKWLEQLKPSALVFIKYDLWPNTIWETHKAGIPIYLVSATLHQKTKRFVSKIGRSFYANLYSHFRGIFVVEESDKKRFMITNPGLQRIEVFGDIRYDSTLDQRNRKAVPQLPADISKKFVFILGSSWPPDEACVFPALSEALSRYSDLVLVIAPHEPTESHLTNTETFFEEFGVSRLSQINSEETTDFRIILVDSVGILSALYKIGHIGYVGGGFTTGVHNVMEPCAMGIPVFFGPIHYNSGEALQLAQSNLAFSVANQDEFKTKFLELMENREQIKHLGEQAKQYIEGQAGATKLSFQAIINDLHSAN